MWLRSRIVQKLSGTFVERLTLGFVCQVQLLWMAWRKERDVVRLLRSVRRGGRSLQMSNEAFLIYSLARAQAARNGVFAEVGVFRGASARLICEVKGDKALHLFDTFEGLPPESELDRKVHRVGQYRGDIESVRSYLKGYSNIHYHQGVFPDSTRSVANGKYSFVHIDVDLYEGTKACLEYFYPRLVSGGMLLSHDYDWTPGIRAAFEEFLADKPEKLIEMPTTQCLILKL